MKNLKIAMILVAAVAFFCSCGDPEAPTVSLLDSGSMNTATFDLATADEYVVALGGAVSDAKGISKIDVTRTMFDANDSVVGDVVTYTFDEPYDGLTDYSFAIAETLAKTDVEGVATVVYKAVVENKKAAQAEASYTITVVAPTYTDGTFEWKRLGSAAATGLSEFGLSWTQSGKTVTAKIVPIENSKLYILTAEDYAITNITDLNAKLTSEATEYRGVNAEAPTNKTYNDVIATVYNGKTYLINVTASVGTVETQGNQIIITGTYKAFDNATPVAAK